MTYRPHRKLAYAKGRVHKQYVFLSTWQHCALLFLTKKFNDAEHDNKPQTGKQNLAQFLLSLVSIRHWSAGKRQVLNCSSLFTLLLPLFIKMTLCFTRRFFENNYQLYFGDQLVHKRAKQTLYHCNLYIFTSGDGLLLIAQNSLR